MSNTDAERRAYYGSLSPAERSERMLTEIGLGVAKANTHTITNEEESAFWDLLEADVKAKARGAIIDYDIRD